MIWTIKKHWTRLKTEVYDVWGSKIFKKWFQQIINMSWPVTENLNKESE